jgi:hypothetical protein
MIKNHIVSYSGGVCSFWAAHRVIDKFGSGNVKLLFADVLMEDEDLYRFNQDVAEYFGIPITRISREKTPWQLFNDRQMIGNSRFPLCSVKLKRELLDDWIDRHCLVRETVRYVGLDWTEEHRLIALQEALYPWQFIAPMIEKPLWDKCKMLDELRLLGIKPPRLYDLGFPHNNCGGFCVKAGQAQFAQLLKHMPERYAFHEDEEQKLRRKVGNYSILKDRRNAESKPLTLRRLRKRIEAGESFDRDDWGGCGCAVD